MRVFVITGAGVSAESGIPTFRGKGGYWRNLDPTKLATPEAFARDPHVVWEWYRERRERIRASQPNAAHHAIAKLAQHAGESLLVTQNVDDLHARAGMPPESMVQIHGDIFVTRCSRCDFCRRDRGGSPEPPEAWTAKSKSGRLRSIAPTSDDHVNFLRCPKCDALMRPGVVWFGEQLPWKEVQRVEDYLDRGACDMVIVAGTTATFGYIINWAFRASSGGELIEVNLEETPLSRFATRLVREPAAVALPQIVDELIRSQ
jgi:NAD-dependent deacetylase